MRIPPNSAGSGIAACGGGHGARSGGGSNCVPFAAGEPLLGRCHGVACRLPPIRGAVEFDGWGRVDTAVTATATAAPTVRARVPGSSLVR